MATIFSNKQIAEDALRLIGDYSVHETGADPDSFAIAMRWLDYVVANIAAVYKPAWLRKVATSVPIPASTNPLDVVSLAGPTLIDPARMQYVENVWLAGPTAPNGRPLTRINSDEYNELPDKAATGFAGCVYIDNTPRHPMFYLDRMPTTANYSLVINWLQLAPIINGIPSGSHGFKESWQLSLVHVLGSFLGDGPILHLEPGRADGYAKKGYQMLEQLFGVENVENDDPFLIKFEDF